MLTLQSSLPKIACHQAIALWGVEVYPQAPKWHPHQEDPTTSLETL